MLDSGVEVQWLTQTKFVVPSQTEPGKTWQVDLMWHECSCPASNWESKYILLHCLLYFVVIFLFLTDGCKHIQFGMLLLAKDSVSLKDLQRSAVENLMREESYIVDDQTVEILHEDRVTVFSRVDSKCSCIAFSQLQSCVCSMLVQQINLEEPKDEPMESTETECSGTSKEDSEIPISQVVQELSDACHCPRIERILRRAHAEAFSSFQSSNTRKNIRPLQPYRRAMLARKKALEHAYQRDSGKTTNRQRKYKTPNDFHSSTSSSLVRKSRRVKGIKEIYKK